ncbi:DUF3325 family protein [Eilatimonas milleporae]|uniref:Uncharacterized protein DUF3325 n=1 Tax=Eilatimonas milleporae TaxID=911205 RepID=A0A3M0C437_9PROT|nr:DUF3325 family protein [Eilatimonas milleporae]RMB04584.1 uncharacterized protein DUF3325 [Eilatimonas milleporae]
MTVLLATLLLYLAVYAFYHAHPARSGYAAVRSSARLQRGLRMCGWGLAGLSLVAFSSINGFERGVVYWLAVLMAVGLVSLFLGAWRPESHRKTALPVAVLTGAVLTVSVVGVA